MCAALARRVQLHRRVGWLLHVLLVWPQRWQRPAPTRLRCETPAMARRTCDGFAGAARAFFLSSEEKTERGLGVSLGPLRCDHHRLVIPLRLRGSSPHESLQRPRRKKAVVWASLSSLSAPWQPPSLLLRIACLRVDSLYAGRWPINLTETLGGLVRARLGSLRAVRRTQPQIGAGLATDGVFFVWTVPFHRSRCEQDLFRLCSLRRFTLLVAACRGMLRAL